MVQASMLAFAVDRSMSPVSEALAATKMPAKAAMEMTGSALLSSDMARGGISGDGVALLQLAAAEVDDSGDEPAR